MPSSKCYKCSSIFDYTDEEIGSQITCVCGAKVLLPSRPTRPSPWTFLFVGTCTFLIAGSVFVWALVKDRQPPPTLPAAVSKPDIFDLVSKNAAESAQRSPSNTISQPTPTVNNHSPLSAETIY